MTIDASQNYLAVGYTEGTLNSVGNVDVHCRNELEGTHQKRMASFVLTLKILINVIGVPGECLVFACLPNE